MTSAGRFLQTCDLRQTDSRPVWLMRQAGRYLPEYREIRERHSFKEMVTTPELCAEITLQPIRRYDLDAAIIFSDILVVLEALGAPYEIIEGRGPVLEQTVRTAADLDGLSSGLETGDLDYVYESLGLLRAELATELALLGFAGAPWTLACYLVSGGSSQGGFPEITDLSRDDPALLAKILERLTDAVIAHLKAQLQAGADAVQVFDSWAGMLGRKQYRELVLPHMQRIATALAGERVIYFLKGATHYLSAEEAAQFRLLSVDHQRPLSYYRDKLGSDIVLQGNLDPAALRLDPAELMAETRKVLADHGPGPGHIFNLGHGITPDIPPEHVQVMVETVRAFAPVTA